MKILVFTGGGLAPALNPTLYGVIKTAQKKGWQVLGGKFGWASMLPDGKTIDLTKVNINVLKNHGGTILRSSRTNPFKTENIVEIIKNRIKELDIDAIIAIGGDDTLGAAKKLSEAGVPIIGIPKTIDNDLATTYFTPGFPSAAFYLSDFVRQIKEDAAYTLSRIFIIESLGMKAGWLATSSIYGGADIIIPCEWEIDLEYLTKKVKEVYEKNGNYAVIVLGQEAKFNPQLNAVEDTQLGEQFGHKRQHFVCLALRDYLKEKLGIETKALYPGNYLESDSPIKIDQKLAIKLGQKAIELVAKKQFGMTPVISRPHPEKNKLQVDIVPINEVATEKYNSMPAEYFDLKNFQPTQKFLDYMEPILGKYKKTDDEYTKLIKLINN